MIEKILRAVKAYNPSSNLERIRESYLFAKKKLEASDKKVFDAFGILEILLPLRPDDETIMVAFLYPVYAADIATEKEVLSQFGESVCTLLIGLRRLDSINYSENDRKSQQEVFRRMMLAMAKDIRVIFLKLSLRLWKLQNLELFDPETRKILAYETLDIYAPVAARLGIYNLKDRLEDLAFKCMNFEMFSELSEELEYFGEKKKTAISAIQKKLKQFLKEQGYDAEVSGRIKSIYSIHKKLERKGLRSLNDLYDIFAIRVVLPSKVDDGNMEMVDHLYGVLGIIHSRWKPLSKRFKDYVAVPKPNGYRSLHTVILGIAPKEIDKPVEIQIRSSNMHDEAEYGSSSHWMYKEDGSVEAARAVDWLKNLRSIQESLASENDVTKEIEVDIFKDRIFVLTPRGEVKDLPVGATPLDFAYSVHSEIGNKCVMAKVDGAIVPLDYELKNGNVVEVVTRTDATPKLQWLSFVKTSFAKSKIKAWFSNLNKETHVRDGKKLLNAHLLRFALPPLDQNYSILKIYAGRELSLPEREKIVQEIGKGAQLPGDILRKVVAYREVVEKSKGVKSVPESSKKLNLPLEKMILVGGESDLPIKFASCCKPEYGDKVVAYVTTRGKNMTIHKTSCLYLDSLNRNKIVHAEWKNDRPMSGGMRAAIKLAVFSRLGLIRDITAAISDMGMHIVDVKMEGRREGMHYDYFTVEFDDFDKFDALMNKLEQIPGVLSASRDG